MRAIIFKPRRKGIDPCARFREKLAQQKPIGQTSFPVVQTITAVGAIYSEDGISENDQYHFLHTLNTCHDLGINISRQFHLTPLNPMCKRKQDFLALNKQTATDLLAAWYVYNPSSPNDGCWLPSSADPRQFYVSPHHFQKDIWHDTAARSAVKIIVPIANYYGVNPSDIKKISSCAKILANQGQRDREIWSSEVNAGHFFGPAYAIISNAYLSIPVLVRKDLVDLLPRRNGLRIVMPS